MHEEFRFIQLSDIHIGSPKSFRYQPAWVENFETAINQIKSLDHQPDFLIISGDLTRDGDTHEYELKCVKERLDDLPWSTHVIPGNHDSGNRFHKDYHCSITKDSLDRYKKIFSNDKFYFEHKGTIFIGFNSFLFESDLPEEEKLWSWLKETSLKSKSKNQIWFMHPAPFFKSPDEENTLYGESEWSHIIGKNNIQRLTNLMKESGVKTLSSGHIHIYNDQIIDNIRYINCPSTAFKLGQKKINGDSTLGFLQWRVKDGVIDIKRHALNHESRKTGYGPGGNIPMKERDYSIAWES